MGWIYDPNQQVWKLENGGRMIPKFQKAGILKKIYYWRSPDYSGVSFNDAFAAARHFKDKDFWWNGNIYNTNVKQSTQPSTVSPSQKRVATSKPYVPSQAIKNYIKSTEAYRPNWYTDGNGITTIGYGFTEKANPHLRKKYPKSMPKADADTYFEKLVTDNISRFQELTPNFDKLNQNQRDALFSYYYNIGQGNYSTNSPAMQEALRKQNWAEVAKQMDFGYNDAKNPGLRERRDYERNLFLTPVN